MHQSKLFTLFKTFSQSEIKEFVKFLDSPFHNTNSTLISFFKFLKKYYPEFDSTSLSKEKAFKKIFPNEPFSDRKMRRLMTEMVARVEQFIIQLELRNQDFVQKKLHYQSLANRRLNSFFFKNMEVLIEEREQLEELPTFYDHELLELHHTLVFYPDFQRPTHGAKHFQSLMNRLDRHFILNKMRFGIELLIRQKMYSEKFEIHLYDEVIQLLKSQNWEFDFQLKLYQQLFELHLNGINLPMYESAKSLYLEHHHRFSLSENRTIHGIFINYISPLFIKNPKIWGHKLLEWYDLAFQIGTILPDGKISNTTFLNVIILGSRIRKFEWTKRFIEEKEQFLNPEFKIAYVNLGMAFLSFYQHQFDKSEAHIQAINGYKIPHKMQARSLSLRNHYEFLSQDSTYHDTFLHQVDAFEKYIRRNQFWSENKLNKYLEFASLIRRFAKIEDMNRLTPHERNHLRQEIKSKNVLVKDWFLSKIET